MKRKRLITRVVVAVLLCILIRTVWLIGEREWVRAQGERAVAAAVAETEAIDPEWQWEQLEAARRKPEPGKNSADVLRKVSELSPLPVLTQSGKTKWPPESPTISANVNYPKHVVMAAHTTLERVRPAIDLALTLKDYPDGYTQLNLTPDVISTQLPHVDATRHAAALLNCELAIALDATDSDRATTAVWALFNTSRSIGDDPFLITQVVRMANRVIACRACERLLGQTAPDASTLTAFQKVWAAEAEEPLLLNGLRGERAVMDIMYRNFIDGASTPDARGGLPVSDQGLFNRYAWWLYRVRFLKDRAYYHRYLTRAVEIARKPIHEQTTSMGDLPPLPGDDMRLAQLFIPAVEKCADAFWRNVAEMRCTTIGLACERFRLKHGRWPASLAELCPDFLATVPLDPFDGQPLRFAKQDDGVIVHSVGRVPRNGLMPVNRPGLPQGIELGFRLWNPDQRRLPPPPDPPPPKDEDKP